jgi:hypothetical protein
MRATPWPAGTIPGDLFADRADFGGELDCELF